LQKDSHQINVNRFLNKIVEVAIYDGSTVLGKLLGVDRSHHGALGNLILQYNGGLNVIRGDSVQSIAPAAEIWVSEPIYSQIQKIAEENGVDVDALANGLLGAMMDEIDDTQLVEFMQRG
jgi:small nuclear ribonucleoprotein (snRNP)-like protein